MRAREAGDPEKPAGQARVRRSGRSPFKDPSRYVFILPASIMILVFSIFPLIFSLVLSFVSWDLSRLQGGIRFAGLSNFLQLFSDRRFWNTARVTLVFVLCGVALQYVVGLGVALLLNQEVRFRRFFRVVFLMPMMLTPAAVGYVGRMLFNETQGPVNNIIRHLGGPIVPWLSNALVALPTLILVDTWEWVPFMIIVLLAGLKSLPPDVFEAASADGANSFQIFTHITFPMILPTSVTVVLIRALEALQAVRHRGRHDGRRAGQRNRVGDLVRLPHGPDLRPPGVRLRHRLLPSDHRHDLLLGIPAQHAPPHRGRTIARSACTDQGSGRSEQGERSPTSCSSPGRWWPCSLCTGC
jgi:multiple sugar transport system permease protein